MPSLALPLRILGLLALNIPTGSDLPFLVALLSSERGWEINESPTSTDPTPDSGWEMDPNG